MADTAQTQVQVDLNRADLKTLRTLPGIGAKLAQRIIQYRQEVHPFEEPVEITAVPGVSEKMYREFAHRLTAVPVEGWPPPDTDLALDESDATEAAEVDPAEETAVPELAADETPADYPPDDQDLAPEPMAQDGYLIDSGEEEANDNGYLLETGDEEGADEGYLLETDEEEAGYEIEEPEEYEIRSEPAGSGGFWRPWLLMVVGALGGMLLSLLILQALNGTLVLANHPMVVHMEERVFALEQQNRGLNQELTDLKAAQASREQRLETRIQAGENRLNNLDQTAKSLDSRLTALSADLTGLGGQVANLETHARQTDETLAELKENTGRFDAFLTGLRDLLLAVQGAPAADSAPETAQPATTPTPAATPKN
jgi:hypothetical protein